MSKLHGCILGRFNALHLGLDWKGVLWMSCIYGSWVAGARCPFQWPWLNHDRTTAHNPYSILYHVQPNISAWNIFLLPSNMVFTRRKFRTYFHFEQARGRWHRFPFGARVSTEAWGTSESVNGHPDITNQVLPELVVWCCLLFDIVWCC